MSENKSIYQALIEFQQIAPVIKKNETANVKGVSKKTGNEYLMVYDYTSFDNIQKQIREPLAKCKLGYLQPITDRGLETIIFHESGEKIESIFPLNLLKDNIQDLGSAITYAKRYSLQAALGLIVEDKDDDGHTANQANVQTNVQTSKPQVQTQTQNQSQDIDLSLLIQPFGKAKSDQGLEVGFKTVTINPAQAKECGFKWNDTYDKNGKKYVLLAPNQEIFNLLVDQNEMKAINGYQLSSKAKINFDELPNVDVDVENTFPEGVFE
jgi:hypothetical protein